MCWVHTHTYKHSMRKREQRKRILFPLTWSKAPLANLLISWVLPHSVSPTTTTDNPDIFTNTCQWSFCDFLKEFLEFYNRSPRILNRRVLQLNNFNSWIHTAGLLWNTLIIQRLYKLLEQSLFLLTIGNSLNCCLLSPPNSRLLHFSGASTSPRESNPQLWAGGTGWSL